MTLGYINHIRYMKVNLNSISLKKVRIWDSISVERNENQEGAQNTVLEGLVLVVGDLGSVLQICA